jgi:hypothetical protein
MFNLPVAILRPAWVVLLLTVVATEACADVGAGAITITCDAAHDFVEVRLHILWNEELESFRAQHPQGTSAAGSNYTTLLEGLGQSYQRSCKTESRVVVATLQGVETLSVTENDVAVATRRIDPMWFTADFEHRLRSTESQSWEECINDKYASFNGKLRCGPITSSTSTSPEEIKERWKR